MAAPADIWPHSTTVLESVRTQFGLRLSRHGGEGGYQFDRRRPRLTDLGPSMNSPTKQTILSKKLREESSLEKKDFIDLMQLAREWKRSDRDGLDNIRVLVSLVWKGLNTEGRARLQFNLCFLVPITLAFGAFLIPENVLPSPIVGIVPSACLIISLFFPPSRRGGSGGPPGCGSCGGGSCGGGGCGGGGCGG